jgi:hypothetical protein
VYVYDPAGNRLILHEAIGASDWPTDKG